MSSPSLRGEVRLYTFSRLEHDVLCFDWICILLQQWSWGKKRRNQAILFSCLWSSHRMARHWIHFIVRLDYPVSFKGSAWTLKRKYTTYIYIYITAKHGQARKSFTSAIFATGLTPLLKVPFQVHFYYCTPGFSFWFAQPFRISI